MLHSSLRFATRAPSEPVAIHPQAFLPVGLIAHDVDTGTGFGDSATARRPALSIDALPSLGSLDGTASADQAAQRIMQFLGRKAFDDALAASIELTRSAPANPIGYNLLGASYGGKGDLVKARESFEQALRIQPKYIPALMNLGQLDLKQRNLAGARSRYQAILAIDAHDPRAMLGMASADVLEGNERSAREWLEHAKRDQPKVLAPRLLLAVLDMRKKAFASAIAGLKAARDIEPTNIEVLELLGDAQGAAGEHADAIETYKAIVAQQPKSLRAHRQLASAYERAGSLNLAEAELRLSLQIQPNDRDTIALAYLALKASRYGDATRLADGIRRSSPAAAAVLDGDIAARQNRFRDAAVSYEKAFVAKPAGSVVAKLHFARTRSGNAKQADADAERWVSEHPRDTGLRHYLAAEYLNAGRKAEAIKHYEAIVDAAPRDVLALNNLAALYQSVGDSRALATAEKAYQIAPSSPIVGDTLGWVLVKQGGVTRGLPLLQKAETSDPRSPVFQYHVAAGLAVAGQRNEARRKLQGLLDNPTEFPERAEAEQLLKRL